MTQPTKHRADLRFNCPTKKRPDFTTAISELPDLKAMLLSESKLREMQEGFSDVSLRIISSQPEVDAEQVKNEIQLLCTQFGVNFSELTIFTKFPIVKPDPNMRLIPGQAPHEILKKLLASGLPQHFK